MNNPKITDASIGTQNDTEVEKAMETALTETFGVTAEEAHELVEALTTEEDDSDDDSDLDADDDSEDAFEALEDADAE